MAEIFERRIHLPVNVEEAFAWHERPGALDQTNDRSGNRGQRVAEDDKSLAPSGAIRPRAGPQLQQTGN